MLQTKYVVTQQKIKEILKDRYFAITTDSWTSTANHGYVTCTAHFVNKDTWTLLPFNPTNQPPDMDLMFADLYQYYRQEHQQHEQQQINGEHLINNKNEHQ
jgi:hypothetical protein